MDWVDRLGDAMAYIEAHLDGELRWDEAARLALCPPHQLSRTFALITGIPLSEYVRLRRLALAAADLQAGRGRVLDVALRYGYTSPTTFQRAFLQFHGVTPSRAHLRGTSLKSYPPLSFHISIEGGIALQFRIEDRPAFRVVGFGEDISMEGGNNFTRIPQMWAELDEARCAPLMALADGRYPGMFGYMSMPDGPEMVRYDICVCSRREDIPDGLEARDIAAATYAIFSTSLADIQDTTRRIFAQWLPDSGYRHANAPEFEYYPDGNNSDPAKYLCEIWIPIEPR